MASSCLGDILHLNIQKGKDDMKASKFQHDIKGTSAYMKRLMMDTKSCSQLTSNDTYFSDRWFNGVKTYQEVMHVMR